MSSDAPARNGDPNSFEMSQTNASNPSPSTSAARNNLPVVYEDGGEIGEVNVDFMRDDIEDEVFDEKNKKRDWNKFKESRVDAEPLSFRGCFELSKKILKIFFIVVAFLLIFTCIVVSKLCVIFIASNLINSAGVTKFTVLNNQSCVDETHLYPTRCGVPACDNSLPNQASDFPAVRWFWAMFLCLSIPYVVIILRSLRKLLFKKENKQPRLKSTVAVLVTESLHTLGLMTLMYHCLPMLDGTRAILLMTGVGFTPSILRLLIKQNIGLVVVDAIVLAVQLSAIIFYPVLSSVSPITENYQSTISCTNASWPHMLLTESDAMQMPEIDFWPIAVSLVLISLAHWENFVNENLKECKSNIGRESPQGNAAGNGTVRSNITTNNTSSVENQETPVDESTGQPEGRNHNNETNSQEQVPHSDDGRIYRTGALRKFLWELKVDVQSTRTKTNLIVYPFKLALTFGLVFLFFNIKFIGNVDVGELFDWDNFQVHTCETETINNYDWLVLVAIQASVTIVGYYTATLTVMAYVQVPAFSLAVSLATPASIGVLYWACTDCDNVWMLDTFSFFNCWNGWGSWSDLVVERWVYVGFLWWLSQLWISRHLWTPTIERMARTDRIMARPGYCGGLLEQSLAYNRRRNDQECRVTEHQGNKKKEGVANDSIALDHQFSVTSQDTNHTPQLYLCATLWHEEVKEMTQILKSLFRLDKYAWFPTKVHEMVEISKTKIQFKDNDYFKFEAHMFFDDAFEKYEKKSYDYTVNKYVRSLAKCIPEACLSVYEPKFGVGPPEICRTPYGGRLIYIFPGGSKLTVHLKDKQKIRNKKRWSQVMYMYYFLGYRLEDEEIPVKDKELVADNTFLLALDGDVDFKPEAVRMLLDLMKRNSKVGAACGRIHPIGSGPMVWYQQFEYAIGHWLQKATEHVLGCVLCSPGCFSLFRGSALMDDNVMKTYTKKPETPRHHVQYDQGEDRWLCTLLLQAGYRVEYSAAADALTYAPEGFEEFFKQRRRWTPSTMSNILDLLESAGPTVRKNVNISWLYMVYQGTLFFTSILGPGTILMLLIGALGATYFPSAQWIGFLLIFLPVLAFVIVTLTCKTDTQLKVAFVLSVIGIILQMIVVVGLALMISEDGLCNPASWIMVWVLGVFFLAAILHPQEGLKVLFLPVYFVLIPSMYMILIIFAICNLNDIGWGTREGSTSKAETGNNKANDMATQIASHSRNCCPCFGVDDVRTLVIDMNKTLHNIQLQVVNTKEPNNQMLKESLNNNDEDQSKTEPVAGPSQVNLQQNSNTAHTAQKRTARHVSFSGMPEPDYSDDDDEPLDSTVYDKNDPKWIHDESFGDPPNLTKLPNDEKIFWKDLIKEYLLPMNTEMKEQEELAENLKSLRDMAALAFFMFNIVFIVLISTLEAAQLDFSYNCTRPATGEQVVVDVGAITIAFTFIFGLVMALQVVGMLFHRIFTLLQVLSSTEIWKKKTDDKGKALFDAESNPEEGLSMKAAVDLVKEIDQMDIDPGQQSNTSCEEQPGPSSRNAYQQRRGRVDSRARPHDSLNKQFYTKYLALRKKTEGGNTAAMPPQNRALTRLLSVGDHTKDAEIRERYQINDDHINRVRTRSVNRVYSRLASTPYPDYD